MIKKLLCGFLICLMFVNSISNVNAAQNKEEDKQVNEPKFTVEELYQFRNVLVMDYDFYEDEIAEIDRKLEKLGVEEISQSEVEAKLGLIDEYAVQPCYDVTSTSDIKWTSKREYYVYRGKSYELQVIRGVPDGQVGRLCSSDAQPKLAKADSGFKAAAKNVSKIIVNSVAGSLPQIGGMINTAQTFYDVFKGVISGLSPTTSLGPIECNYTSSMVANYLYVFVKYSGDIDAGNQILAYCGNWIDYSTTITIPSPIKVNGVWRANVDAVNVRGTITSPYYNWYRDVASNVFWEYKNGNPNVTTRYDTYRFWIQALDDKIMLEAPYAFPY